MCAPGSSACADRFSRFTFTSDAHPFFAIRAVQHQIRDCNRCFFFDNAALRVLLRLTHRFFHNVQAFHQDPVFARFDVQYFSGLPRARTADPYDRVVFLDRCCAHCTIHCRPHAEVKAPQVPATQLSYNSYLVIHGQQARKSSSLWDCESHPR